MSGSRVLDSKACMREMSVCIPQNYSKYSLPNDGQTIISLGVDIRDIPKIDDNDFIITITAYLSIQWTDPRLIIDEERFKEISGNRSWTPVEKHFFNELWLPDVEILNLKDLETKDVFAKLENQWLTDKFEVGYEIISRISIVCAMSYINFPFDSQSCLFQVRMTQILISKKYYLYYLHITGWIPEIL